MIKKTILLISLFIFLPSGIFAWSDHNLGVLAALEVMPEIRDAKAVRVEKLESFLQAEEKGIEDALAKEEEWARKNIPEYASRPTNIAFKATGNSNDIRERFLHAIRVNPEVKLALFTVFPPGCKADCKKIPYDDVASTVDDITATKLTYCGLESGDIIAPIDVIASASNEPDFEIDIGLWKDNGNPTGRLYGFGRQPFGNPKLAYTTRTPFHMGFYHESQVVYLLAPFLKRTYPEYRIHLYQALSRFAFKTGHPYWGYRFMGLGIHYVEDLTQPYHTTPLPGSHALGLIWINLQDILGSHKAKSDAIQLVSNRHLALEDFERTIIRRAYQDREKNNPLLSALIRTNRDSSYGSFTDMYPITVVSKESHAKAKDLDAALRKWMPEKFVNDPDYNVDPAVREENVYGELIKIHPEAVAPLTNMLADLFESFGAHSRNYVRSIKGNGAN